MMHANGMLRTGDREKAGMDLSEVADALSQGVAGRLASTSEALEEREQLRCGKPFGDQFVDRLLADARKKALPPATPDPKLVEFFMGQMSYRLGQTV